MIVAVTGGTGFIGKKLVARLMERGDIVRLLTRNSSVVEKSHSLEIVRCDLLTARINELSMMFDGVDVIYHCAGQLTNTESMRALHVDATQKLVKAASGKVGRWVQLSSVGVYGPVKHGEVDEDSALNPIGVYETTKAEADQIVIDAANKGAFSYSILRPSNVFGAGMNNQSLYSLITMIDRGLFFYIGKQGASANYIHVDNVVEGLIRCATMESARNRIFNLSDHRTLKQLVNMIAEGLGCKAHRIRIPKLFAQMVGLTMGKMPGFPLTQARVEALSLRSKYPISRIQQELGYQHLVSMEDGLQELVKEYKQRSRRIVT